MSPEEQAIRQRLKDDYEHYASKCLKIRTKSGAVSPLQLNKAQKFTHDRLEKQLKDTGRIRALILKGRQQGISTYVEGRYYWKVSHRKGVRAFILTHDDAATSNLFEMAQRYHEQCPELVRPATNASNAKELLFGALDSGYKVGTAGNKAVGRSSTIQYFHGSEVAFWPHAEEHAAGIMQAIPDAEGTEVILESTANGLNNYFYTQWKLAEQGDSDFIAIFVPWFWQPEYSKAVPQSFQLTDEDQQYRDAYGLTLEQMAWRRSKQSEFAAAGGDGEWRFKQEYPATAAEAFQTADTDTLITPQSVMVARTCPSPERIGPLIVGVDPARFGPDASGIAWRQGRVICKVDRYKKLDSMRLAGVCKMILDREPVKAMFIDVGGIGAGTYDRLCEMGYSERVKAVDFGGKPLDEVKYYNKRSEMWGEMAAWLKNTPCAIPDDDMIQGDLCAPLYRYDSNGAMKLEPKDDIKKRLLRSPDLGDAMALTFAAPVVELFDDDDDYHATNNSGRSQIGGY